MGSENGRSMILGKFEFVVPVGLAWVVWRCVAVSCSGAMGVDEYLRSAEEEECCCKKGKND